jgi:uncharacterized protein YkwD
VNLSRRFVGLSLSLLVCTGIAPTSASAHRHAWQAPSAHARRLHGPRARCAGLRNDACLGAPPETPRAPRPHTLAAPGHRPHTSRHAPPPHAAPHAAPTSQPPKSSATATIAAVLATPCQGTQATPEAANLAQVDATVLCLINQVRAQHGESPLAIDPRLQRAAEEHASELVADDYFAHVSPSGVSPVARIKADGYVPSPQDGYVIGENLAWGTLGLATPESIVQAWVASPGHLANILEGQYQQTGIAVVPAVPSSLASGQAGATYAQEFGVVLR